MRRIASFAVLLAGVAAAQPPPPFDVSQAERVLTLQATTAHVQGIDTDGTHLWVTAVDRATKKGFLQQFDAMRGTLERTIELQDGERYHPGGIAADADSIWIPVAEYKASSTAVIQKRNRRTLALEFQFSVPDHIGCLAVTPEYLIGGNWDSREFYVWDHQGKLLRKVAITTGNAYQDMKVHGGFLVASGTVAGQGAIDWLELGAFQLDRRRMAGTTDTGAALTREGMTVFQNQLWLLPEDGASRLFVLGIR